MSSLNGEEGHPPRRHDDDQMPFPDKMSVWISFLTIVGLIVWVTVTHYRASVPTPSYWLTAAAPIWAALVVLGLQMVFLVASAIHATRREQMGMADMLVSIATFIVTVILVVLYVVDKLNFGPNQINGLAAFLWTNGVEMLATIGVWMVANRRPGGVIGGH